MSGDAEEASAMASIEGLGLVQFCQNVTCRQSGTLVPFTLGQAFEISGATHAAGGTITKEGGVSEMHITMQLFELDGTPVTISAAPEPSTWLLAAFGLTLLGTFRAKRYR